MKHEAWNMKHVTSLPQIIDLIIKHGQWLSSVSLKITGVREHGENEQDFVYLVKYPSAFLSWQH